MTALTIYEHVFPVVAGEHDPRDGLTFVDRVCGTAFPISKDTYVTAAHVITQAREFKAQRIGYFVAGKLALVPIKDFEILGNLDVAVIRAPDVPSGYLFPWQKNELARLTEVSAAGYPFGYDPESSEVHARTMRGSIVGVQHFHRFKEKPRVYELSFQCARGLSGAPLVKLGSQPRIVGIVIGNKSTEMNIFTDREVTTGGVTTIVERYEALQFGIALTAEPVLSAESRLLNASLEDFIAANAGLE